MRTERLRFPAVHKNKRYSSDCHICTIFDRFLIQLFIHCSIYIIIAVYHEAVDYVLRNGLMNGYSSGTFGPNDNLSRAQFAQILFNKEGRPVVNYLLQYSDVANGAWYTEAIRWATSQGVVGGYGNGMFGPNDNITREQLAVMLWRYSGSPAATNKELFFNDGSEISGFALEALRWAVENGIINGYGDGRLGPQGQATRAQVAQMLKNFLEAREDED